MVLLHIDVHAPATGLTNEVAVNLAQRYEAQYVCFKKSVVVRYAKATTSTNPTVNDCKHMVYVQFPWITHEHCGANHACARLPLSMDPSVKRTESDYDVGFYANEISRSFTVTLWHDAACTVPLMLGRQASPAGTDSYISDLHMIFELEHADMMA